MPTIFSKYSRSALAGLAFMVAHQNLNSNTNGPFVSARLGAAERGTGEVATSSVELGSTDTGKEINKIISAMNKARTEMKGLGLEIETPEFVVLGKQSAGKSRLIETIAGTKFNYIKKGQGTMRPTHIRFKNDPTMADDVVEWRLKELNEKTEQVEETLYSVEELQEKLMDLHTLDQVSDEEIELECRSKKMYNLDLIDLPGYTALDPMAGADRKYNKKKIDEIIVKAIKKKENRILLVDEVKDIRSIDAIKEYVLENLTEDEYSRVHYVRTKLDKHYANGRDLKKLTSKKFNYAINPFLQVVDQDGEERLLKGMTYATLSCPSWKDEDAKRTTSEFQTMRAELDAQDIQTVKARQLDHRKATGEGLRTAEDDSVLATIGFKNFIDNFQQSVKNEFTKQVIPVRARIEDTRLDLVNGIRRKEDEILSEEHKQSRSDTGKLFAMALTHVAQRNAVKLPDEKTRKPVTQETASLEQDFADFTKDLKLKDVFLDEGNEEVIKCPIKREQAKKDRDLREAQMFTNLEKNLDLHKKEVIALSTMKKTGKDAVDGDEDAGLAKGWPTSRDKLDALIKDLHRYVYAAQPNFDVDEASKMYRPTVSIGASSDGKTEIDHKMRVVEKFVATQGYDVLLHHVTLVALRVKQYMMELYKRTIMFVTQTLQSQTEAGEMSQQSIDMMNAGVENPKVQAALLQRYEQYLHRLVIAFRDSYKEQLEGMFHKPLTLLRTTPKRFAVENFTCIKDHRPKAADGASTTEAAETCSVSSNDSFKIVQQLANRQRALDAEIHKLFNSKNSEKGDRWSEVESGNTIVQLASTIFRFARVRIADGLEAKIHRYFSSSILMNGMQTKQMMQQLRGSGDDIAKKHKDDFMNEDASNFYDFMNGMSLDCFEVDDKVIEKKKKEKEHMQKALAELTNSLKDLNSLKL